jgi:hypothetical protein
MSHIHFTSKLTSRETSSSKQLLRLIKVDEGKCEDEIGISSLLGSSYFTMKIVGATFAANATVPRVRTMP